MTQTDTHPATARPVRVGIVGYGWWGKTIARHVAQSSKLEWAAVAEADTAVRDGLTCDLNQTLAGQTPRVYTRFADLLTCLDLDAVILCTPENPTGWDITTTLKGQAPVTTFAPPHPAVRDNLKAFARAIRGEAPYPVSHTEMLANVAAVEAIMKSVDSKGLESIAAPRLG
jgi:predicted dehydrogenase